MALPIIPSSILNWGKRFSEGIQEKPTEPTIGAPLTPEEEQQISDELQDDPLFTKEENAALRKAEKEAEAKRKKDEEDIAAADRYGEMMAEKDPEKLKKNQESGYQFNPEQEKIVWKYERDKPATRKVGDFLSRAGEAVQQGAVELPVGAYKGLKYTIFDPLTPIRKDATEEEKRKVTEKAGQTARSFGSGVTGGLEDIVYELPKTVYKGGTPVTDWAKELVGAQTEEESYQNFLKRQAARKEFAADEEAMPERTSALLAKGAGALGDVGLLDKQFSKDLEQQLKERALTKDQMVPEVATLGDIFAPDIPLMGRMSKLTAKATGKVGKGVLKGLTGVQVGERRIGLAPAVEAVGYGGRRLGEKINEYSAKIDRAISGSDDWIFRNAVGKTSNFLGKGFGLAESVGRLGTDIGRVVDEGIAGRKGVAERLGQRSTTGRLGNVLFGDASQGLRKKMGELSPAEAAAEAEKNAEKMANRARQGLARARAVDSASRLGQYYANAGINGAAVQVMLGLPNMETWGDVGEATGYGAGMGFVLASNPKSLFVDRVRADQRKAAEGDIGRMMEGLDETTKARLKSLSDPAKFIEQLTKRKDSVQSRVDLLKDIVNSAKKRTIGNTTITPRDALAEIDHLEGTVMPKIDSDIAAAAKTNPQTQKEIEFIINKEFMDSLGNLQAVGENSGLGGDIDVRMLGTDEISAALDEMYKAQKDSAAEIIRTLGGQETLSPEDKKLLDGAIAFEGFLESEKENLSNQRGFALTPAKDMTQDRWWQNGAPVSKPTIIVNSDELKNSRGLDIASVLRHEMFHGMLQFGEVQDMMKDYTDVLFDQYTTDAEGNQIKFSDGIISDEKLRQMADKYSAKYNPLEKGMWRSMFESDADLLNAIKEEFLAETFTQSGGATGMTSNVEDSVVETVLDYGRAQSASSTLGKIRDSLGKMGINIDDSGHSNVLESEIPSQAIALMRQFRRTLRDYNGTLNQIGQAELNAPGSIPLTKIASSKALFNRYKDADFWEREAATTVTAPDGTVLSEEVLPKSAQDKLVTGEWTVQGGKLVPVDPEYSAVVPKALSSMAKGKPDGTKIVAGVRIARNPDGTPRILSKAAVEAVARKRNDLIKQAIDTAPEDGTPNRLKDTGNGNYRGVMSPSQLMAISQIPDIVLPQRMKVLIRKINEMLLRGDGSRFNTEYQAALRGGQYRGMAPRFSDDAPIGFQFSKDGNFLVTTVSVTRLQNKLNAWAKEMPGRLALWNGSKYDFWADFVKVLDNQKKNIPGQTDLDADPAIAEEKKNVINDLLNLYNKDTVDTNPSRTKLKQKRGQDSRDRTIVSRRLDRMLRLDENNAEKLPINYGKVIANALPQAEFNFGEPSPETKRFYQDFEILNKASGEYAGQPIRISVQAKTAEEAEQMISQTPDYQRYNAAYRFNSIGKPYSAPDPSEKMTPEEFAAMKSNAGLGPSSKALPASVFGDFYHGTYNPNDFIGDDYEIDQPKLYGHFDGVEVIYVAPKKIDAQKFGDSTLRAKIENSNIFDPSSKEDLKKFKESAIAAIKENYYEDNPFVPGLEEDYAKRIESLGTNKNSGWSTVERYADIIKDAGFDGYIAWEFGNPQIGLFPDRVFPDFKLDTPGIVTKPFGKVDFAKALPREISGNPTFWKDLYHYTDKDSAEAISIGGFDISKSTEERLFPNTISLTTKDSWNVGDAAVLNELSAENPVIVRVSGNQREGEIGLWDFAKEGEEVSPMELGKRLVDWAQSQGHDVIVARGVPGPGKEYAVLDPSKIKVKSVSKALPQDLSQVTLDERKDKLPPYKTRINYGGRDQFVAIYQDNDKGIEIGRAEYSIERGIDDVVTMFIESSKVGDEYRNKGYGEALYRELAKLAQSEGVTRIEGLANKDAVKVREKLFEKKPDPLGLDMNRIDLINPTTKYLPKSNQDSENYKNYILGKINPSGEERFEIKTNESGKNIYVKKDAPEMPPASTLARGIWQDENLNMYGNSIKTGITKNEWEEFLNDFLKENPESEFAKERKEYLDREKNRKQDEEIRQSQAEVLGFARRQPLELNEDFLKRVEIEKTREGSPFNPNSENFSAYLKINGQAFSPEENAIGEWTFSSTTADEWNSLYLISKLGQEKAAEYIQKIAELGVKVGITVKLSPDSISAAKSGEAVPEEAIANDFWSALKINMASGKFDDIEAMMNEMQELANSRYRDVPGESFEQSRVRGRETESKIQKLEEQIKNRTRALVAISTLTQAQARFSKVGEFKQLIPTINKIKSEAIAELPKKQMIAYRGMVFGKYEQMQKKIEEAFEKQGYYDFEMQPLSSWTLKESLAKTFARHGQGKKQYGYSGEGIIISQPITADNVVMHPNQTIYKDFVSRRAALGEKFNSGGSDQKEAILEHFMPIRLTPQNTKFIKFLPNSDEGYDNRFVQEIENSNNPMKPQKERGLKFLKYAEEEEERPAPLSSLMMN